MPTIGSTDALITNNSHISIIYNPPLTLQTFSLTISISTSTAPPTIESTGSLAREVIMKSALKYGATALYKDILRV